MSLDVYLIQKGANASKSSSGIFIRENGETKEITVQEWNEKFPDKDPVKLQSQQYETDEVYSANITHNLGKMAEEVKIYKYLWRPDELGITKAKELIEPLREGLHKLKLEPDKYREFNPDNGWGTYEVLVKFVENYLNACYNYPNAEVSVSR